LAQRKKGSGQTGGIVYPVRRTSRWCREECPSGPL
jgi:hypothetical protein